MTLKMLKFNSAPVEKLTAFCRAEQAGRKDIIGTKNGIIITEPRAERKLVCTVVVGARYNQLASYTVPLMKLYADKVGADFKILGEHPNIASDNPQYQKLQLYYLLREYDRVVFLDADTMVMPACPSLFEVVPPDLFGAVAVPSDSPIYDIYRMATALEYGITEWAAPFYNCAVLVASRRHREAFNGLPLDTATAVSLAHWPGAPGNDESVINSRIALMRIPSMALNPRFNMLYNFYIGRDKIDLDVDGRAVTVPYVDRHKHAYILHYADANKLKHIVADYNHVFKGTTNA